jgi:ABC-2 type transport system ATP-binding protein
LSSPLTNPALAIEASDLVKTYPGDVRALDGVSFAVAAGTVFGLLGPNGAGKSTTVKILTTLSRADRGQALVNGLDVRRDPERVRQSIGCVAQKSGVDPGATGRENLVLQGQLYGLGGRALKRRVGELLERFGLTGAANRAARTYSGGMQRRLDVAMGLIHQPKVLFLDEPTTGLDPEARADMWEEITRLSDQEGLTILLTTHYLEEADRLARRLAIVDRGRIVVEGTPDDLKRELRGDAIHVELADGLPEVSEAEAAARARAVATVERVEGVAEVRLDGHRLHARVASGATAVPAVIAAVEAAGARVAAVTVARPSLDDVYLRHAGRAYNATGNGDGKTTTPAPATTSGGAR